MDGIKQREVPPALEVAGVSIRNKQELQCLINKHIAFVRHMKQIEKRDMEIQA